MALRVMVLKAVEKVQVREEPILAQYRYLAGPPEVVIGFFAAPNWLQYTTKSGIGK